MGREATPVAERGISWLFISAKKGLEAYTMTVPFHLDVQQNGERGVGIQECAFISIQAGDLRDAPKFQSHSIRQ
jgi:hypothetical protein